MKCHCETILHYFLFSFRFESIQLLVTPLPFSYLLQQEASILIAILQFQCLEITHHSHSNTIETVFRLSNMTQTHFTDSSIEPRQVMFSNQRVGTKKQG